MGQCPKLDKDNMMSKAVIALVLYSACVAADDSKELAELKKQNEQLKKENKLLKAASTPPTSPFNMQPMFRPMALFSEDMQQQPFDGPSDIFSKLFGGLAQLPDMQQGAGGKMVKGATAEPFSCQQQAQKCVCSGHFQGLDHRNLKVQATGNTLEIKGSQSREQEDVESKEEKDKTKAGGSFNFEQVLTLQFEPEGSPEAEYNKDKKMLKVSMQMPKGSTCGTQGSSFSTSTSSFSNLGGGGIQSFSSSSSFGGGGSPMFAGGPVQMASLGR